MRKSQQITLAEEISTKEADLLSTLHGMRKYRAKDQLLCYQTPLLGLPQYQSTCDYYSEFWKMYVITHLQVNQLTNLERQLGRFRDKLQEAETLEEELDELQKTKSKKKNRRAAKDIIKNFTCPYNQCFKSYGSEVSLNLHIKTSHNGGTKTQRQRIATLILDAQAKKQPLPEIKINLPPGFLQKLIRNNHQDRHQPTSD